MLSIDKTYAAHAIVILKSFHSYQISEVVSCIREDWMKGECNLVFED